MDGVYWTIVLELIFYGWVALALMFKVLPKYLFEFCVVWLSVSIFNELWLDSYALRMVGISLYGAWFVIGMMTYHIWSKGWSALASILILTGIATSMAMAVIEHDSAAFSHGYAPDYPTIVLVNAGILALFFVSIAAGRLVPATRWIITLGALTYPLYLVHQHVGYMIINSVDTYIGAWSSVLIAFCIIVTVSWMVAHFWERPLTKIVRDAGNFLIDFFKRCLSSLAHMPGRFRST